MSKKTQTILTICVDISMLAVIVTASYLLLTGKLQGNWIHVAQIAIIAAIPTLFFVSFLNFGMQKYEKMRPEDAWEDEHDETEEQDENKKCTAIIITAVHFLLLIECNAVCPLQHGLF